MQEHAQMQISNKNIKLSDANEYELFENLHRYTENVVVKFDSKTKKFTISAILIPIPCYNHNRFYKVTSLNFHQAVKELSHLLKQGYNDASHLFVSKKRKTIKANKTLVSASYTLKEELI